MSDIFIARQPIYTRELDIHAYELLYRSGNTQQAGVVDGEDATAQVLINALIEIGLPQLVGTQRAFINCTEHYLLQGLPAPIASDQVVLEVLEDVMPGEALLAALKKLRDAGYFIALDDFVYDESKRELVALSDMIKVDVLTLSDAELEQQVDALRPFDVKLLAEKVETQAEFEHCKALGFHYFQGYFLSRPHIVKGSGTPSSKLAILRLLAEMQDPELDMQQLEQHIAQDVSLSYRILRYINSAMLNLPKSVDSIFRAITLLGLTPIKSWVTIIAMSSIDDKPYGLMTQSLVRAKMCEGLAPAMQLPADRAFTVGLFSTLDALMDQHMEELLAQLPLSVEMKAALLRHEGPLGELLQRVLSYERGDWDPLVATEHDSTTLREAYLDAIKWASDISTLLLAA
jgi:EAL and modified HD-GYP domain-containing signal transduction protein